MHAGAAARWLRRQAAVSRAVNVILFLCVNAYAIVPFHPKQTHHRLLILVAFLRHKYVPGRRRRAELFRATQGRRINRSRPSTYLRVQYSTGCCVHVRRCKFNSVLYALLKLISKLIGAYIR
jgi:hypothetical protein